MALRVTMTNHVMTVSTGTVGEPKHDKFKSESAFWYALKQYLMDGTFPPRMGLAGYGVFALIKKQACKDPYWLGPGDGVYYLRDRKARFFIYDPEYAVRALHETLYVGGTVTLRIHHLV